MLSLFVLEVFLSCFGLVLTFVCVEMGSGFGDSRAGGLQGSGVRGLRCDLTHRETVDLEVHPGPGILHRGALTVQGGVFLLKP